MKSLESGDTFPLNAFRWTSQRSSPRTVEPGDVGPRHDGVVATCCNGVALERLYSPSIEASADTTRLRIDLSNGSAACGGSTSRQAMSSFMNVNLVVPGLL